MRENGFRLDVKEAGWDLMQINAEHGVSPNLVSCHTALVGDYVLEGHVPADVAHRLLSESPQIRGLAVPRMPAGVPGMPEAGPDRSRYEIPAIQQDGTLDDAIGAGPVISSLRQAWTDPGSGEERSQAHVSGERNMWRWRSSSSRGEIPRFSGVVGLALLELPYPHVDPVALDFPGPIDVRWYGLMYLVGFAIAYFVLRWLAREEFLRLDPDAVGDLIFALVLGVILGGRLGYIFFYDFGDFLENPARILRIWEGGLSFHGGLLGVLVAAAWFARKHRIPYLNLGDSLALAVPFGIFAVRMANFVNGELYGRIASPDVPWAMRFPTDRVALRLLNAGGGMRAREQAIERAYETGLWEQVAPLVPLRHPSQVYEALLEGVLLALILWAVFAWARKRARPLPAGTYGGIFLVGYGLFRSLVELFRQPDAQFRGPDDPLGTVLGPLTMGQTLSALMILGGLGLLVWTWHREGRPLGAVGSRPMEGSPARANRERDGELEGHRGEGGSE
jgi:phosphatidylglycerol:prolipoprotein diacylglycerol transferase